MTGSLYNKDTNYLLLQIYNVLYSLFFSKYLKVAQFNAPLKFKFTQNEEQQIIKQCNATGSGLKYFQHNAMKENNLALTTDAC